MPNLSIINDRELAIRLAAMKESNPMYGVSESYCLSNMLADQEEIGGEQEYVNFIIAESCRINLAVGFKEMVDLLTLAHKLWSVRGRVPSGNRYRMGGLLRSCGQTDDSVDMRILQ